MTKRSMIAGSLLAAALVSGCAHHAERTPRYPGPASNTPVVLVEDTPSGPQISVSPRTLVFLPGQKDVEIVWRIRQVGSAGAKQFRFAAVGGIEFRGEVKLKVIRVSGVDGPKSASSTEAVDITYLDPRQSEVVNCKASADGLEFRCLNKNTRPGQYKYAIQLIDGKDTFIVDPLLENW